MSLRRTRFVATLIVLLCLLSVGIATVASSGVPTGDPECRPGTDGESQAAAVTVPSVIDGHLEFGSHKVYRNVTIKGVLSNAPGAHDTTFINCRILGVGPTTTCVWATRGELSTTSSSWTALRSRPNGGTNPSHDRHEAARRPTGGAGELHDITFTGCHFGCQQRRARPGSPGMMVEIQDYSEGPANHGFYNINFIGCTFEAGRHGRRSTTPARSRVTSAAPSSTATPSSRIACSRGYCALESIRPRGRAASPWRWCAACVSRATPSGGATGLHHLLQHAGRRRRPSDQQRDHRQHFDFRVDTGIAQKRAGFARTVLLDGKGDTLTQQHRLPSPESDPGERPLRRVPRQHRRPTTESSTSDRSPSEPSSAGATGESLVGFAARCPCRLRGVVLISEAYALS